MKKLVAEPMTWYVLTAIVGIFAVGAWTDVFDGRFTLFDDDTFVALLFTIAAGATFLRGYTLAKDSSNQTM